MGVRHLGTAHRHCTSTLPPLLPSPRRRGEGHPHPHPPPSRGRGFEGRGGGSRWRGIGSWVVPLAVLVSLVLGPAVAWSGPLRTLRELRHWSTPTYTRVVIDVDGEVKYRTGRLRNPDRLYVDLLGTRLSAAVKGRPLEVHDQIVKGIRAAQNQPDIVRVVLDLQALREFHIFTLGEPDRIIIDIKGKGPESFPPPPEPPRPSPQPRAQAESPAASKRLTIAHERRWHVVIDPGHGGKDPGATGPSGLMEKDVVLDIAKRLRGLLQQEPYHRATLTRETDVFIPLEERTAIANGKRADLFVSIHVNAAERAEAQGVETYFLDMATDEQAMRTAARENATSLRRMNDLQLILRDLVLTSKRNESSLLAGSVQQALVHNPAGGKNGRDLGVKHAPFYVLMGAEMPAILVEAAFISNRAEEQRLANPRYRAEVARAILAGIKEYRASIQGSFPRQVAR